MIVPTWGETLATGSAGGTRVGDTAWKYQGRLDVSPAGLATPLYAMGARLYAPGLGIFTSLDTVAGKATNPRSMHRFLYAEANPATLVDPTGHSACSGGSDLCDETMAITYRGTSAGTTAKHRIIRKQQSAAYWIAHRAHAAAAKAFSITHDIESSPIVRAQVAEAQKADMVAADARESRSLGANTARGSGMTVDPGAFTQFNASDLNPGVSSPEIPIQSFSYSVGLYDVTTTTTVQGTVFMSNGGPDAPEVVVKLDPDGVGTSITTGDQSIDFGTNGFSSTAGPISVSKNGTTLSAESRTTISNALGATDTYSSKLGVGPTGVYAASMTWTRDLDLNGVGGASPMRLRTETTIRTTYTYHPERMLTVAAVVVGVFALATGNPQPLQAVRP